MAVKCSKISSSSGLEKFMGTSESVFCCRDKKAKRTHSHCSAENAATRQKQDNLSLKCLFEKVTQLFKCIIVLHIVILQPLLIMLVTFDPDAQQS